LVNGKIATEGGPELITKIDTQGYEWIKDELGIEVEKELDAPLNNVSIGVCATKVKTDGSK
jgi:Fe-S cluster assembly ATP-binding protein